jgi:hypothetical protein
MPARATTNLAALGANASAAVGAAGTLIALEPESHGGS